MAHPEVTKELLEHLAKLARLKIQPAEYEKYMKDLSEVLAYVDQLSEVDTTGVSPMNGCTDLINVFREDEPQANNLRGQGVNSFPETQDGYLKVPPVFEN